MAASSLAAATPPCLTHTLSSLPHTPPLFSSRTRACPHATAPLPFPLSLPHDASPPLAALHPQLHSTSSLHPAQPAPSSSQPQIPAPPLAAPQSRPPSFPLLLPFAAAPRQQQQPTAALRHCRQPLHSYPQPPAAAQHDSPQRQPAAFRSRDAAAPPSRHSRSAIAPSPFHSFAVIAPS